MINLGAFFGIQFAFSLLEQRINFCAGIADVITARIDRLGRPQVFTGVRVGPRSPASEHGVKFVVARKLLERCEFDRFDLAADTDAIQVFPQQIADFDAILPVAGQNGEFEFNARFAIDVAIKIRVEFDLVVQVTVAVRILPTGSREQLFGFIQVLLVGGRRIGWCPARGGMEHAG